MSKLAERLARKIKEQLDVEVLPEIIRSYTHTWDAGEAIFYMPLADDSMKFIRFEERATEIVKSKKLYRYASMALYPNDLDSIGTDDSELKDIDIMRTGAAIRVPSS